MNGLPAAVAPPLVPVTATSSPILRHWPPRSPMPQRTLAASSRADRARLAEQHPMPAHRRRQPVCGWVAGLAGPDQHG